VDRQTAATAAAATTTALGLALSLSLCIESLLGLVEEANWVRKVRGTAAW
jgi:hypothetical protein